MRAAKQHRWTVVLGGPESANYLSEYLGAGADVIVIGEGEVTLAELHRRARARAGRIALHGVRGIAFRDETGAIVRTAERARVPDLDAPAVAGPRSHRSPALPRRLENASRRQQHQSDHRARLSVSLQLVLARGVWLLAPAAQSRERRRRSAVDRRALRAGPGLVRRRRVHDQPSVAGEHTPPSCKRRGIHRPSKPSRAPTACRTKPPRTRAARARLLSHLDRLGERQPADPRCHATRRAASSRCAAPAALAHEQGIQVGMFLMWGYEGEELEDIAATVEHVKQQQSRHLLHHRVLSHQGHGLLRQGARPRASCPSRGRTRPIATT